jgi:hypothetical protein
MDVAKRFLPTRIFTKENIPMVSPTDKDDMFGATELNTKGPLLMA